MAPGRINLSVADARDLAEGALRGIGYHNDEARIIADHVIDAAMCGYDGEVNRVRKKHDRAIIAADVRRFGHVINKDGVLGTHSCSPSPVFRFFRN